MAARSLERGAVGFAVVVSTLGMGCRDAPAAAADEGDPNGVETVDLPAPRTTGAMPLETSIRRRRSERSFAPVALTTEEIGQLAWAAQGITEEEHGLRAAPSAGALHPLELYVVDARGVWHYEPARAVLRRVAGGDRRARLARAAFDQPHVGAAPVDLVLTGVMARTRAKYGDRAERYVHIEAGHAAQNVLLEATAMGLAAVPVGAFDDDDVRRALGLGTEESPLYVICVGRPQR